MKAKTIHLTNPRLAGAIWGALALTLVLLLVAGTGFAGDDDTKSKYSSDDGFLGIYMQDLTRDIRRGLDIDTNKGVLVGDVIDDSPAEQAGLEEGDVIIMFNGEDVSSSQELRDMVRDTEPGDKIILTIVRDGDEEKINVTIGEAPEDSDWSGIFEGDRHHWREFAREFKHDFQHDFKSYASVFTKRRQLGVHATELTDDLAGYFDVKPDAGVLVLSVVEESVAEEAGVKAGDVITSVGDESIADVDDLREAMQEFDEGDEIKISIVRKGKKQALTGTMTEQDDVFMFNMRAPRVRVREPIKLRIHQDELREEVEMLREEIQELREEIKKDRDRG